MAINWARFQLGGLAASILCFITDGVIHEPILHAAWGEVYTALGATPPAHDSTGFAYFILFELGRGFGIMFLYVLLRDRIAPGPKTALLAGAVAWVAFSFTGPAQFVPLGFLSLSLWLTIAGLQLVTTLLAALAAAAPYKS